MRPRDALELVALAMLWGAAYLFMRTGAPQFGPMALVALRTGIAAMLLLSLLALRGRLPQLRRHAGPLLALGVVNSVIPFALYGFAALHITAGLASVLNATSPMFTAIVAYFWFGERLTRARVLGLVVGVAGVAVLAWDRLSLSGAAELPAILACLLASAAYGVGGNFARHRLTGVDAGAVAAGSQTGACLVLAPWAVFAWPQHAIAPAAWAGVLVLGLACTGVAFILYFRLIAHVGPTKAITVTFLIPAFGVAFGALFLDEPVGARMLAGSAIVLAGTALATGVLRLPERRVRAPG